MDEQGLHRVTSAVALRFAVVSDTNSHIDVCLIIDIDMTDTVQMFYHRHARVFADAFDERFAAARNNYVNILRAGY